MMQQEVIVKDVQKIPLLETRGVTKLFPGVVALDKIDFEVVKGEVHAIVGENGAGKSTLCNVITGIYAPNEGEIFWEGEKIQLSSTRDALNKGIRMVYQERNLIPFLTGAQNVCLGEEETKNGLVDEKKLIEIAHRLQERLGTNVPLDVPINRLPPSARQMIEILRAFHHEPKLLILDEPTSSLTEADVEVLFQVIENIKKEDISVIFISHKLPEVFRISDRISIFRNGKKVFTGKCCDLDRETCIRHMIDRDLKNQYPEVVSTAKGKLIEVKDVSSADGKIKNANLYVNKGEVVGLFGLVGSGRTELAEVIYGLRAKDGGGIVFEGEELNVKSPEGIVAKGIFLLPEDRREHGLLYNFKLKGNLTISFLKGRLSGFLGMLKLQEEQRLAKSIADSSQLNLKYRDINQDVRELSGGNKQKVVIGRWINQENMKLIIMDEPTQGIDVGTKYEIYVLMRDLARRSIGVIFISSELPELLGVCDRLYIFRSGEVVAELNRAEFSEEKVLDYALH